jgi:hypothetical protein
MKHTWLMYWSTCRNVEKFVHFFWSYNFLVSLILTHITNTLHFSTQKKSRFLSNENEVFPVSRNLDFPIILIKFLLQSVNFVCLALRNTLLPFNLEHAKLVLLILFCHPNWLSCVTRDAFAIRSYNFLETISHRTLYKNLIIGVSTLYIECHKDHLTMKTKF